MIPAHTCSMRTDRCADATRNATTTIAGIHFYWTSLIAPVNSTHECSTVCVCVHTYI